MRLILRSGNVVRRIDEGTDREGKKIVQSLNQLIDLIVRLFSSR